MSDYYLSAFVWRSDDICFGRPCLRGTRVPVEEVAERFKLGESIAAIASDFYVTQEMVEAAIRLMLLMGRDSLTSQRGLKKLDWLVPKQASVRGRRAS